MGFSTNFSCKERYSSSVRISAMRLVNTGVSINSIVISLHCKYTLLAYCCQDVVYFYGTRITSAQSNGRSAPQKFPDTCLKYFPKSPSRAPPKQILFDKPRRQWGR